MIAATTGELASGLVGEGRMAEPEDIVRFIESDILKALPLRGKNVLVTAGPTYEAIDPVRFIGNHSSGKMGFEIALAAVNLGANVTLVSGPTHQLVSHSLIKVIPVVTASDMYNKVHQFVKQAHIIIMAAAVADYKPKKTASQKIKKADTTLSIELEKTKDILKSVGEIKTGQFLVGFALETNNEVEHALKKLRSKNLDLIVLNSLQDEGAGFGHDTNRVTFIDRHNKISTFELKSKSEVAIDLAHKIIDLCNSEAQS